MLVREFQQFVRPRRDQVRGDVANRAPAHSARTWRYLEPANLLELAKSTGNRPLSPTLQPLEDIKDQVVVLSNLWNANSKGGDGHYVKEAAILTCATIKKTPGADLANATSMDQVAAQRVAAQTPLPSP